MVGCPLTARGGQEGTPIACSVDIGRAVYATGGNLEAARLAHESGDERRTLQLAWDGINHDIGQMKEAEKKLLIEAAMRSIAWAARSTRCSTASAA